MEIKVFLDPHETEDDAQEALMKAFASHAESDKTFHQPGARAVYEEMLKKHNVMWSQMLKDIFAVIENEI